MRLIDADSLKEDLLTFFPPTVRIGLTANTMLNQILNDIDNQPTVVAKAERGYWLTRNSNDYSLKFFCSVCGNCQTYKITRFCPNCGSMMEYEEVLRVETD